MEPSSRSASHLLDRLSGLIWYARCKRDALDRIRRFVPPADSIAMRMAYSQYFVNLQSLIDRSTELFGSDVRNQWISSLNGFGDQDGRGNERYLRELRNAIVHRGFDPTGAGNVIGGFVLARSPRMIPDRHGANVAFRLPAEYLLQIAFHCETIIPSLVLDHANTTLSEIKSIPLNQRKDEILQTIRDSEHIPDEIKGFVLSKFDEFSWERFIQNDHQSLEEALNPGF